MNFFKNQKTKVYIFFIIFLIGVAFIFFNESGILKFLKLRSQVNTLNEQIEKLQEQNKNLQAEIDSLKNKIPAKIEKVAREKYGMKRPGETRIQVIEK